MYEVPLTQLNANGFDNDNNDCRVLNSSVVTPLPCSKKFVSVDTIRVDESGCDSEKLSVVDASSSSIQSKKGSRYFKKNYFLKDSTTTSNDIVKDTRRGDFEIRDPRDKFDLYRFAFRG